MEPTLRAGDRLLVRYDAAPTAGRLAVVRLPPEADGTPRPVAVKRLSHPQDGGWWVERDNPSYGVDSWLVGAVPTADVVALVLGRIWPRPSLLRHGPDNRRGNARPDAPG
jgi:phage repressor protein C with HTH and peptisase S24 domain